MRTKDEILSELHNHTLRLDPQHKELALVAMAETEIQIDIRDILADLMKAFLIYGQSKVTGK